jgi:hypothetical protein
MPLAQQLVAKVGDRRFCQPGELYGTDRRLRDVVNVRLVLLPGRALQQRRALEPQPRRLDDGDALALRCMGALADLVLGLGEPCLGVALTGERLLMAMPIRMFGIDVLIEIVGNPGGLDLSARFPCALANRSHF